MFRAFSLLIICNLLFSFKVTDLSDGKLSLFPNFSFTGMFDKNYQLSDLKGNYVLINFWASWNEESRKMQLKQTPIYTKFRDQTFKEANGFEIVSVSIDTEPTDMQLALKKDHLNWANHYNEINAWEGKLVRDIQLKGIPANYLLDSKGIVIAQNIEADSLEMLLKGFQ
jgi:thiol-disulfide isomerase/thioredoxin